MRWKKRKSSSNSERDRVKTATSRTGRKKRTVNKIRETRFVHSNVRDRRLLTVVGECVDKLYTDVDMQ